MQAASRQSHPSPASAPGLCVACTANSLIAVEEVHYVVSFFFLMCRCAAYHQIPLGNGLLLLLMMALCVCGRSEQAGVHAPGHWVVSYTAWLGAQMLLCPCWLLLWTHVSSFSPQVREEPPPPPRMYSWALLLLPSLATASPVQLGINGVDNSP